ncbi:hypothetical protein MLD38_018417 [Melastoma candidum]|uniref:Uncharacterized protein n=1 Tax=Melastoma candidum TaxID=119954 RepID=A0ACB9QTS5_9MYRT|nr:hypothetical protein MLD38_018417 [Melastoma candidum]
MPRKTVQPRRGHHLSASSTSSFGNHLPPSPSSSRRRRETPRQRTLHRPRSKGVTLPVHVLRRCSSAPGSLSRNGGIEGEDDSSVQGDMASSCTFNHGPLLFRGHTCLDVLSPSSPSCSPEGYSKDAKVVVNVTVQGSPGPIRTMVRLGCSVEDTIMAVVDRYGKEGRTPKLDRDSVYGYELHHSYFSLQSLEKSEHIGCVGSRSFYLRTSSNNSISPGSSVTPLHPTTNPPPPVIPPLFMASTFIAHMLGKIVRRAQKLWKVVICSQ